MSIDTPVELTDEEIETVWAGRSDPPVRAQDATDATDSGDGDATDTGDGDATDSGDGDATDSGDADGADADGADADGQDA
ncbi:MAG TPA: hypothetical protein VM287_07625 [Egibacteraceae bacterium]|nr:hypothetical protein [Egibacteraceae bacterium]